MTSGRVPELVLASASPRRADVLRQLGLDFRIHPADVDESRREGEEPSTYVERLAREKARAVVADGSTESGAVVVAGDTVVVHRGRVLLKPDDPVDAVAILEELSGDTHEVLTGVAVARGAELESGVARAEVRFSDVDRATLEAYVATGESMDKAGAYGIQGRGAALIAGIGGDYYVVVGQPVTLLLELLGRLGVRYDFSASLVLEPPPS